MNSYDLFLIYNINNISEKWKAEVATSNKLKNNYIVYRIKLYHKLL